MEAFESVGLWRLWRNDAELVGRLSYTPASGLRLALIEPLKSEDDPFAQPKNCLLICGVTDRGEPVTLQECMGLRSSTSFSGVRTREFRADVGYLGAHFDRPEDIRFSRAAMELSYLADWVGESGFGMSKGGPTEEMTLTFTRPPGREGASRHGTFSVGFGFDTRGNWLSSLEIQQTTFISLDRDRPWPLRRWLRQVLSPLQNLVTLGTARPNAVARLHVFIPADAASEDQGRNSRPISVVYQPIFAEVRSAARLAPHEMLFTFKDLGEAWPQAIDRWLTASRELRTVCDVFFGTEYHPQMYLDPLLSKLR